MIQKYPYPTPETYTLKTVDSYPDLGRNWASIVDNY